MLWSRGNCRLTRRPWRRASNSTWKTVVWWTRPRRSQVIGAVELAKSFTEEITDADWERLSKLYFDTKQSQTERANLDEIDAHFSPETADGALAGYYEILPFARPITVLIEGMAWLFDDQYCVQPKCACHDLVMSFSRVDPGVHPSGGESDPVIRYDYRTGQYRAECPAAAGVPSPRVFIGAMNDAQPDLNAFLANRHAQLRHLYRRTLPTPVRTEAPKIGRNEACPCGSGKKYKRCCGK